MFLYSNYPYHRHTQTALFLSLVCLIQTLSPGFAADTPPPTQKPIAQKATTQTSQVQPLSLSPITPLSNKSRQGTTDLNLDVAISTAVRNNPELKAFRINADIADAAVVTAGTRLNPMATSDNGIAETTYRLGIAQTIELGGKRKKRVAAAEANKQKTLAEINVQLLGLRGQARQAYTKLYIAGEQEKAYREILNDTDQLLNIAQMREKAGDIARMDVLSARISRTNARNDLQRAHYQAIEKRNVLGRVLYKPVEEGVQLQAPTQFNGLPTNPNIAPHAEGALQATVTQASLPDVNELITLALSQRPELFVNQFQNLQNDANETLAKAKRIPNLTLTAGPDYVYASSGSTMNVFAIGTMDIPIFDRQQGPLQEAAARRRQLAVSREALRNTITYDVMAAHNSFTASEERLRVYENELLPDANQVVRMTRLSFKEGKTSILTSLHAQQAYIATRLGYLEALNAYQTAITNLEKAIGAGL